MLLHRATVTIALSVFTFYVPGRSGGHIATAQNTVFSSQVPIRIDITLIHPSIGQRIFGSTIFDIASLSSPGRDDRSTHIYIMKTPIVVLLS